MSEKPSPIRLVTRTRNKWKQAGKPRTIGDNAVALGYIVWQLALTAAKKLHQEDFRYDSDEQRLRVIEEYLAFLVHIADRMTFSSLEQDERAVFVAGVARSAARHFERNKEEIMGAGNHGAAFLHTVNLRSSEYSSCAYTDEPGYTLLRTLGSHVQNIMGSDQTNKWVMDQVMDIDAPDLCRRLSSSLVSLIESS
ncbi:hypothetical protein ACFL1S_07895 [Pseudomonadota bacterium]